MDRLALRRVSGVIYRPLRHDPGEGRGGAYRNAGKEKPQPWRDPNGLYAIGASVGSAAFILKFVILMSTA